MHNNYVYVKDLVDLACRCIEGEHINVTINVGGMEFDWDEYLCELAKVCKVELPFIKCLNMSLEEFRVYAREHRWNFPHNTFFDFVLQNKQAQELYNWSPSTSLHCGLSAIANSRVG